MHFIWLILIGFVIGLIARMLTPGKGPKGFIITSIVGIVGSVVGAFLGQGLGLYVEGEPAGFVMSVIGAIILLFIARNLGDD